MKWPTDVIAQIALDEWPNRGTATVAVAVALAGSGGDDSFRYEPGAKVLPTLMGAWAIPWLPEMESLGLNPYALRDNAKLARIMTGPNGDEWEWSAVYRSGNWKAKMAEARKGIDNPRVGMQQLSPIPVTRQDGVPDRLLNMAIATGQRLQDAAKAFRQPLNPRR